MRLKFENFEDYLQHNIAGKSKRYSSYCGIIKKDHPRWRGWNIINKLKDPEEVCPDLDLLVVNFYYVKYLELNLDHN